LRGELAKYMSGLASRAADLRPVWRYVEAVLRVAMRGQLEGSHGPEGGGYKPLKESTLKKKFPPRRSSRPYDLDQRRTWNMFAQMAHGRITRSRDTLEVAVPTKGAFYVGGGTKYMPPRPVGPSEASADEIAEIIAEYLVTEERQEKLPGVF